MNDKPLRQLVTIGIPVYKKLPTKFELFSFERSCKILHKYPFTIITHHDLDIGTYTTKLKEYNIGFEIKYFNKNYFEDINGYNQLMVSPSFYDSFSGYHYLLIHQLDAFVFSDQLAQWCNKGYDYIGAPWLNVKWVNRRQINNKLSFFARYPFLLKLLKGKDGLVGNGGFSLRKIDSHLQFARAYSKYFPGLEFNEDVFWGKYVASKERVFKIPLLQEALSFAIENDPANGFKLLNNKVPFGCHAWFEKEIETWEAIFKIAGINISILKA